MENTSTSETEVPSEAVSKSSKAGASKVESSSVEETTLAADKDSEKGKADKSSSKPKKDAPARSSSRPARKTQRSNKKEPPRNVLQEPTQPPRPAVEISLRTLLEAGAHFGHQCSRWNPKMSPYIYTSRNGIHILDLPKSVQAWKFAREAIIKTVASGKTVLFVGTKKQAQEAISEEAGRCGAYFVTRRWLGGMMTNFQTIRKSIDRMKKLEVILAEEEEIMAKGETSNYKKKERLLMSKELTKLEFSLGGIRNMYSSPGLIFVVDIKREDIAIKEAKRLDIPVVALVDTNCDPEKVDYPIPSNDDGTRSIRLFSEAVCDAVLEGAKQFKQMAKIKKAESEKSAAEKTKAKAAKPSADKEAKKEGAPVKEASAKDETKAEPSKAAEGDSAPKASAE